eukprot:1619156-Prymnesium_polylepis.1
MREADVKRWYDYTPVALTDAAGLRDVLSRPVCIVGCTTFQMQRVEAGLPKGELFDLLLVDEASQVRPPRACLLYTSDAADDM